MRTAKLTSDGQVKLTPGKFLFLLFTPLSSSLFLHLFILRLFLRKQTMFAEILSQVFCKQRISPATGSRYVPVVSAFHVSTREESASAVNENERLESCVPRQ